MKALMKSLTAVLMLSAAMSMQLARDTWAGPLDGAMFSAQYIAQDRGDGVSEGRDRRQFREARPAQPVPQPPRDGTRGQLTQDERRQLHRDLDKANRELYSGNRRRTVPGD